MSSCDTGLKVSFFLQLTVLRARFVMQYAQVSPHWKHTPDTDTVMNVLSVVTSVTAGQKILTLVALWAEL